MISLMRVISNPNKGLIPRVLDYLYQKLPIVSEKCDFYLSFLEIYNDVVTDLLDSDTTASLL
jgi:hypothetical protein